MELRIKRGCISCLFSLSLQRGTTCYFGHSQKQDDCNDFQMNVDTVCKFKGAYDRITGELINAG